ncbi:MULTISPECIES: hypothetical protein [Methylobacterium]|jgi:hypothetical protein|uniref:DUF6894 domain-containing protein n=1 Tax=Methylobacterium bullatum TaxID=570505 RepID=A0AAV4Z606_9HYPH|nr:MULTISPECIES: hypothetical protein [Methylobacterium]KQO54158.1 hypothetical protein ASF08_16215 [Methylobacterium sp. Leaf85]MBD8903136.1 hypothetical protein [Methylobacterium bullatum]TXN26485.1 hypothetical protein FV220_14895 [Methylobacterium sp. WL19]GJD39058.1 hypothetical protein OICFNHDK_1510 [Methylobacterium bullatum]
MPRYFLNLRDRDGLHRDFDGDVFDSMDEVRNDAVIGIKQIVADALGGGATLSEALDRSFEVVDEAGMTVLTISFAEGVASRSTP